MNGEQKKRLAELEKQMGKPGDETQPLGFDVLELLEKLVDVEDEPDPYYQRAYRTLGRALEKINEEPAPAP